MQLSDYVKAILARKRLVALCVILVTVPTVLVSRYLAPTYEGEAQLVVKEPATAATLLGSFESRPFQDPQRYIGTQMEAMKSRTLVEQVITKLNMETTPDKLLGRVTISNDGQSDIVTINVTDSTADRAASTANTWAETYVAWATDLQRASLKVAAQDVEARLTIAQEQIAAIEATLPLSGASGDGRVRLQAAKDWYQRLASTLDQLQTNVQLVSGPGSILTTAVVNPVPVSPNPVRNWALALVLGLVFGLGVALVAEYLDNTIKSADEASLLYGAPVIGQITEDRSKKSDPCKPIVLNDPAGPVAESYRGLRNNLEFIDFERSIKTLLVTSAVPGEGKSTVAANLAVVLARGGWKVALVVIDFRRAAAEARFGLERSPGLSEVLAGTRDLASVVQRPLDGLLLVPSGEAPPNPNELLRSAAMQRLLATLAESADIILVDTPPVLAVADAATAARWADATLVVTQDGLTTRAAADKARRQLDSVGARIIGIVVTNVKPTEAEGGGYSVYSGFGSQT